MLSLKKNQKSLYVTAHCITKHYIIILRIFTLLIKRLRLFKFYIKLTNVCSIKHHRYTLLKSPHVHKKARTQLEQQSHMLRWKIFFPETGTIFEIEQKYKISHFIHLLSSTKNIEVSFHQDISIIFESSF